MDYKKMIIELLEKIDNESLIEYLYGMIKTISEKWG